jgi:hypothetical protein
MDENQRCHARASCIIGRLHEAVGRRRIVLLDAREQAASPATVQQNSLPDTGALPQTLPVFSRLPMASYANGNDSFAAGLVTN